MSGLTPDGVLLEWRLDGVGRRPGFVRCLWNSPMMFDRQPKPRSIASHANVPSEVQRADGTTTPPGSNIFSREDFVDVWWFSSVGDLPSMQTQTLTLGRSHSACSGAGSSQIYGLVRGRLRREFGTLTTCRVSLSPGLSHFSQVGFGTRCGGAL